MSASPLDILREIVEDAANQAKYMSPDDWRNPILPPWLLERAQAAVGVADGHLSPDAAPRGEA